MRIKTLKDIKNLKGLRALVRVDYNLSINKGKIDFKDNLRIKASLPTLKFLLSEGATVILMAHLGRPSFAKATDGRPEGWDKKLGLELIAKYLAKLIHKPVNFIPDNITEKDAGKKIKKGLNMLENIRFYPAETDAKQSKNFAKLLARLGDVYINEGFSVSHRADASVAVIQNFLPSYAGLNLEEELSNLSRLLPKNIKRQNRQYVALMGGAKISTKIGLIDKLLKCANHVLIGGALVNDALKSKGYELGGSLSENVSPKIIKGILKNKKAILPKDFVVGRADDKKSIRTVRLAETKKLCGPDEKILDIGPETVLEFSKYIKKAQTIMWNGPMGLFEIPAFSYGTISLARLIAARGKGRAYAVVGGGETIAALNLTEMEKYIDWVSTGGGAMLSFLAGEKMPGLKKIIK